MTVIEVLIMPTSAPNGDGQIKSIMLDADNFSKDRDGNAVDVYKGNEFIATFPLHAIGGVVKRFNVETTTP